MPDTPTTPECTCGYDLSGLDGPPWQCPECSAITNVWPPPPRSMDLTTLESRVLKCAGGAILCAALTAPWLPSRAGMVTVCVAFLACFVFAGAVTWWLVRGDRGWDRLLGIMPFFLVLCTCVMVTGLLSGLSTFIASQLR